MNKFLVLGVSCLFFSGAATAATITGNATVLIQNTIGTSQTQQMNFATVSPTANPGVVTLSPAGVASSSTLDTYGTGAAGKFNIVAQPSTLLNISFSNGTVSNGSESMTLDNFTSTSIPASNTTDSSGLLALSVGANLNVGANQPSGTYNGTYTVTVSY